jgi:ligand-binding sensor domain-containing protein
MKLSFLRLVYFIVTICFSSVLYSQNEPQFAEGIYYEHYGIEEGLPSNETYFAHQDEDGNMWFTTDRGVVKYDGYDFEVYTEEDGLAELVNFQIKAGPEKGFWIIGQTGRLSYFDGTHFSSFQNNDTLLKLYTKDYSSFIFLDIDKEFIYITQTKKSYINDFDRQVIVINKGTSSITTYTSYNKNLNNPICQNYFKIQDSIGSIISIYKYKEGRLIITETDTSYIVSDSNGIEQIIKREQKEICLLPFSDRFFIRAQQDSILYTNLKDSNTNIINGIEASSIYFGDFGNMWICSARNGIYKTRINLNNQIKFKSFRVLRMEYADTVYAAQLRKKGLSKTYYSSSKTLSSFQKNKESSNVTLQLNKAFSFTFGKYEYDSNKMNYTINRRGVFKNDSIQILPATINQVTIINNKSCLLATNRGIIKIKVPIDTLIYEPIDYLPKERFNSIRKLNENYITCDINGNIYIIKDSILHRFSSPFKTNTLHYTNGFLLVGAAKGLLIYKEKSLHDWDLISFIDKSDGLSNSYITSIAAKGDSIVLGTLNGLNIFHLDNLLEEQKTPSYSFKIEAIWSNNQITNSNKFKKNDFITILFKAISHNKISFLPQYRYKLLLNRTEVQQWKETDERKINFFNLAPGDYSFEVQCRNRSLQWSPSETVEFSILPHFTETKTFQITVLLVFGLLLYGGYSFIYSRRLKEQALISEINEVKMKLTRQQLNPHFIYNALNALQNFIFKDQKEEANRYLKRLSTLIRDSLEFSEMEALPLQREVSFMERYLELEKSRYPDRFDYEIKTNVSSDITEPQVPSLLVQTLAENAIKHGFKNITHKGFLSIQYDCPSPDETSIIVEDNGQGFNGMYNNEGFGLKLIKRRIQIYNNEHKANQADLTITYQDDDKKSGCIVHIHIHKTPL